MKLLKAVYNFIANAARLHAEARDRLVEHKHDDSKIRGS